MSGYQQDRNDVEQVHDYRHFSAEQMRLAGQPHVHPQQSTVINVPNLGNESYNPQDQRSRQQQQQQPQQQPQQQQQYQPEVSPTNRHKRGSSFAASTESATRHKTSSTSRAAKQDFQLEDLSDYVIDRDPGSGDASGTASGSGSGSGGRGKAKAKMNWKKGPPSCSECIRLKLKVSISPIPEDSLSVANRCTDTQCSRNWPCESCVRRGCASICPTGTLRPK